MFSIRTDRGIVAVQVSMVLLACSGSTDLGQDVAGGGGAGAGGSKPSDTPEGNGGSGAGVDGDGGDAVSGDNSTDGGAPSEGFTASGASCSSYEPYEGECPFNCNGGCVDGICIMDCTGDACRSKILDCPDAMACWVKCKGNDACRDTIVSCPQTGPCQLDCDGTDSCPTTYLNCFGEDYACAANCFAGAMLDSSKIECDETSGNCACQIDSSCLN